MTREQEITEKMLGISTSNFASAIDYGAYRAGFIDGVDWADRTMVEEVCEWLRNNWRDYVDVDSDGVVCFGHWENDFRNAMKGGER